VPALLPRNNSIAEAFAAPLEGAAIPERVSLIRLFLIFLRIGCTTWGGFMTFIAVVSKSLTARGLATEEDITDSILVAQVLPGPVAVDMTVAVGYRLRGIPGAAVCWLGSVLPSFIVVTTLSLLYLKYGTLPAVDRIFKGFPSAMVAIVAVAAYEMGKKQVKSGSQLAIAVGACAAIVLQSAFFQGAWWVTLSVVFVAGTIGWYLFKAKSAPPPAPAGPRGGSAPRLKSFFPPALALALAPVPLLKIFLTFAVMSVSLFGSGYVFIPIIKGQLVNTLHWITVPEFTAGLALTQITPGPILMTAAFVGLKIAGLPGAIAGMLGMFGPPALLTLAAAGSLQAIKKSSVVTAALKGVRPAVVGMLFAAAVVVGETMPHDTLAHDAASGAILAGALVALLRFRVEVALIIPLAGAAGFLLFPR
jgi:chromate transporter